MQVICVQPIDSSARGLEDSPRPQVGDIDTVIATVDMGGQDYYRLVRFTGLLFRTDCFATLPTEDQEVAIEHEQESIIYAR